MQIQDIKQLAASHGLAVRTRLDEPDAWWSTALMSAYAPVLYTNASVEFQWAYQRGHGGDWQDLSLLILWDNRPAAVWPLSYAHKDGGAVLSSHGTPVLPPLFARDCAGSSRKRIVKGCLDLADAIARRGGIVSWSSAESFSGTQGLSEWHAESMARGAACSVSHELFLDLAPDLAEIRRRFRKSYKPLISSGQRLWSVSVLDEPDAAIWNEFRELHFKASQRQTRSDETWEVHLRDIAPERSFLVCLRDESGVMVGAGFFNCTRDEGLYAVAAYDRSLFDKPLGHVVQYRAIEEFKARGTHWYRIGARPFVADLPAPNAKEISIGEFKQGFASHLLPRFMLTHPVAAATPQAVDE